MAVKIGNFNFSIPLLDSNPKTMSWKEFRTAALASGALMSSDGQAILFPIAGGSSRVSQSDYNKMSEFQAKQLLTNTTTAVLQGLNPLHNIPFGVQTTAQAGTESAKRLITSPFKGIDQGLDGEQDGGGGVGGLLLLIAGAAVVIAIFK